MSMEWRRSIGRAVICCACAAGAGPGAALADDGSKAEPITVYGATPVEVIDPDLIRRTTTTTIDQLLGKRPQFQPSVTEAVNLGNAGIASLDLRGLGSFRTLVLVNGRRQPSYSAGGVVDLNMIAPALVKRIDVLTGGASTAFGSDAVAGVVNIVLDDRLEGVALDASSRITGRADGGVLDLSASAGSALGDGGHITASVSLTRRRTIIQGARPFAARPLSSADLKSSAGSTTAVPTVIVNSFRPGGPSSYQVTADGGIAPFYADYNSAAPSALIVPLDRWSATVLGDHALSDDVTAFAEARFTRSIVTTLFAPTGTFGSAFSIRPDNPFLGDAQRSLLFGPGARTSADGSTTLSIDRRFVEAGDRRVRYDNRGWQMVGGLRGSAGALGWEAFAHYGETWRAARYRGDVSRARVTQALDAVAGADGPACRDASGGCRPLDLFSGGPIADDAIAFVSADGAQSEHTSQLVLGASLSAPLAAVASPWAGSPTTVTLGAEYRGETARSSVSAAYGSGDLIGYGQGRAFPAFAYDVAEAFGDLRVPLAQDRPFARSLVIEAAVRLADYSTAGRATAWKAGGVWQPLRPLSVRMNWTRSVRAPSLFEYASPRFAGLDVVANDPCAGAVPSSDAALAALCVATGVPVSQVGRVPSALLVSATFGGNEALRAETAHGFTGGAEWVPLPDLRLSADWFSIRVRDAIGTFGGSSQSVVTGCYTVVRNAADPFCAAIARNPVTGGLGGGAGVGVMQLFANGARLSTRGADIGLRYNRRLGRGRIALSLSGSWVDRYRRQAVAFVPALDCAGRFGLACGMAPMPRWRHIGALDFGVGPFSLFAQWRHVGPVSADERTPILVRRIPAYDYLDLTLSVDVSDRYTLRAGVQNLFDTDPPLVGSRAGSPVVNAGNSFPGVYDVRGATVFVGVSARL